MRAYPGDPGALVALLLNDVSLEPGEAVFLPAGQLHMYLDGLGVEVMGASDNVVRGGLTPKHVDVARAGAHHRPPAGPPDVLRPGDRRLVPVRRRRCSRSSSSANPSQWTAAGTELVVCVEADGEHPAGSASVVLDGERGGLRRRARLPGHPFTRFLISTIFSVGVVGVERPCRRAAGCGPWRPRARPAWCRPGRWRRRCRAR